MATRKSTKTARKAVKKAGASKSAGRKAPAKKAAKKTAKKAVKKSARKAVKKSAAKKTARKTTQARRSASKSPRKAAAKKATKKTTKNAAKKAVTKKRTATASARKTPAKAGARKSASTRGAPAKKASGAGARKSARKSPADAQPAADVQTPAETHSTGAGGVTTAEIAQRRRARRMDARTTVEPADATTSNFSTSRSATPRDSDRGTSRTRKPHRITPEEALANTRELLEAKQARDREPPPWRQFDPDHGQPASQQLNPEEGAEHDAKAEAHAEELHRGESRLDAIQGSVSQQDRHQQGRHDAGD